MSETKKREPTMDEIIRRHESYIEGLIDGVAIARVDFRARDIRGPLISLLDAVVGDVRHHDDEKREDREDA